MNDLGLSLTAEVNDRWKYLHESKHPPHIKQHTSSVQQDSKKVDDSDNPASDCLKKLLQFKALIYKVIF